MASSQQGSVVHGLGHDPVLLAPGPHGDAVFTELKIDILLLLILRINMLGKSSERATLLVM